jgi:putative phage-type endonuclease
MTQAPAILEPRVSWLKKRQSILTASDCPAVLGMDPRRGPLSVYASKVLGQTDEDELDWMTWGRDVEGAIAKGYARKTLRPVFDRDPYEIAIHPDIPWLGATLDRTTEGCPELPAPAGATGRAPLELKAVGGASVREWKGEAPPDHFAAQVQIQIACTGAQWGALGALLYGVQIEPRDILRHDTFLTAAIPALEEFRWRVENRQPPEADGLPATRAAIGALYGVEDGETIYLPDDTLSLVEEWEQASAAKTEAEEKVETLRNILRARLGSASFGNLKDGSWLQAPITNRKGFTVQPTSYRRLVRKHPKAVSRRRA